MLEGCVDYLSQSIVPAVLNAEEGIDDDIVHAIVGKLFTMKNKKSIKDLYLKLLTKILIRVVYKPS